MDIKNVIKNEFIGEKLEVLESKNMDLVGVKGKVIDETKNMFVLDNGNKVVKDQCVFKIVVDNENYRIDGKLLVGRPEDRLKKKIK
jgi:ribonuclease P protein subunit POP4